MTIGVVTNVSKDKNFKYTGEVCEFLTAKGIDYTRGECERSDLWVVLGGDGTMLRAAHTAAILGIPMLGINLGTLGYLTAADVQDGTKAISSVLEGNFSKESRLMLEAEADCGIAGNDLAPGERVALNDVYISNRTGKLTEFSLYINDLFIDTLRADGVLVSTPTGSTAYNLAAGGPILMPDGDMMVITAVCPHTLHIRPWVISSRDKVRIRVSSGSAVFALDGEERLPLSTGNSVVIRGSAYRAEIIKTASPHFYEILRKKLR